MNIVYIISESCAHSEHHVLGKMYILFEIVVYIVQDFLVHDVHYTLLMFWVMG
jgi:hypothetical protein